MVTVSMSCIVHQMFFVLIIFLAKRKAGEESKIGRLQEKAKKLVGLLETEAGPSTAFSSGKCPKLSFTMPIDQLH